MRHDDMGGAFVSGRLGVKEVGANGYGWGVNMKSCLVVDDSKVVRMVARKILESLNFRIEEAENGKVAYDSCTRQMPDAILLDWNMPVMSGIDFLRALRKMEGGQTPIVVFCTTENDMAHIQEAIGAGANEYIMKPFDSEIIESKFSQVGLI
jgi:two-component system chemotaxis response regulator CheY